jgi:hypothetical protein
MITKLARNNHNKTSKIASILIRGDSFVNSTPVVGFGVSVMIIGLGVFVAVVVVVDTGKINVITGNGKSVVVGVSEGNGGGVYVSDGVPGVSVWTCVIVPALAVPVTTAA